MFSLSTAAPRTNFATSHCRRILGEVLANVLPLLGVVAGGGQSCCAATTAKNMMQTLEQRILAFSSPPTPWRANCTERALNLVARVFVELSPSFRFAKPAWNKRQAAPESARQHGSTFGPIPPRCVTVISFVSCTTYFALARPRLSRQDNSPLSHTQAVKTHQYHLLSPHKDNTSGSQDTGDEAFVVRASRNSAHGACWLRDVCLMVELKSTEKTVLCSVETAINGYAGVFRCVNWCCTLRLG